MLSSLSKSRLLALLALLSLNTMNSSLRACECWDSSECNRMYVGAFGGGIYSSSTKVSQMGTVFFPELAGGPLAVVAQGHTNKTSSGFGGAQIGYEWSKNSRCSDWMLASALEIEAYWYNHTKKGHLINVEGRPEERDFLDSLPMDVGVYLANVVFSLNNSCFGAFSPYIGGGIGATRLSIKNATSIQTSPTELENHFNSRQSDSSWAFAAQAKAGIRYHVCESLHIFGEYRYLFVDSSHYIFGSTVYPTHAPTSPWNVKVQNIQYNAFVFGVRYEL